MHFGWSRSRGIVAQASSLWGKQASPPARKPAGEMPACPTAMMAVLPHLRRCVGFDGPHPHSCSLREIGIFRAKKSPATSLINVAPICFLEIGGTKKFGHAVNG